MSAPADAAADQTWFTDATVLVVDDHQPNRVLMERILQHAGVSTVHAIGDAAEAIRRYRELGPDIVLLDLHMPGMDGVDVMRALRALVPDGDFVPIVVITADATHDARDRVLEAGANDFLTKPVDRAEVVLRTRNLLRTRMLHGRLQAHNDDLRREIASRQAAEDAARAAVAERRARIQGVLDQDGARVAYQPMTRLIDGAVVGYEALARFDGEPRRPTNEWFDDAASVGLGTELELAVVRRALTGFDAVPGSWFMSLNVSPATVLSPDIAAMCAAQVPQRLVVELTEHVPVGDYGALHAGLAGMREAGVRVAVDDAGAGYASLQHILRIQPDIIKLDIALVRDIDSDPVKRALASSLVTFGSEIGADIVAEGVETAEELEALVELGVPFGQGYHLGRPGPLG